MKHSIYLHLSLILSFFGTKNIVCSENSTSEIHTVVIDKNKSEDLKVYCSKIDVTMEFEKDNDTCIVKYRDSYDSPKETPLKKDMQFKKNKGIQLFSDSLNLHNNNTNLNIHKKLSPKKNEVPVSNTVMIECLDYNKNRILVEQEWLDDIIRKGSQRDHICKPVIDNSKKLFGLGLLRTKDSTQPILLRRLILLMTEKTTVDYRQEFPLSHKEKILKENFIKGTRRDWENNPQYEDGFSTRTKIIYDDEGSYFIGWTDNKSKRMIMGTDAVYIPIDYYFNTVKKFKK